MTRDIIKETFDDLSGNALYGELTERDVYYFYMMAFHGAVVVSSQSWNNELLGNSYTQWSIEEFMEGASKEGAGGQGLNAALQPSSANINEGEQK